MHQAQKRIAFAVLGALSLASLTGCEAHFYGERRYAVREEYVDEGPPPLRRDVVVGVSPGPDYIWIGGRWGRDRGRWAWNEGHWDRRPYARAYWEAGRWEHRERGYVWVDGRWRR